MKTPTTYLGAAIQWMAYARRELERGDARQAAVAIEHAETALAAKEGDLTRPIIGIENRTPQEVFDIMCSRICPERVSA